MVCSVRHEPIRAPHARAAARPRPLRAQYPEDGGPREGRRQEAPPARQDAQVPGDRPPPDRGRRGRRVRGEGGRGRGDGRGRRAQPAHHHRGGGAREDRPAAGRARPPARDPRGGGPSRQRARAGPRGGGRGPRAQRAGRRGRGRPADRRASPASRRGRAGRAPCWRSPRCTCAGCRATRDTARTSSASRSGGGRRTVDGPAHADARALREARAGGGHRDRRLERHLQHRHGARGAHRAAVRLLLRDGPRLPADRRTARGGLRRVRDGAHRADHRHERAEPRRWR